MIVHAEASTDEAGEQELQQLVLYDDKAKLAHEAVEDKVKIKKGKKLKQRGVTDWDAYSKGKKDADHVQLACNTLPAPVAKSCARQSKAAGASTSGGQRKSCLAQKRSSVGKEQKPPAGMQGKVSTSAVPQKNVGKARTSGGAGRTVLGNAANQRAK